MTPNLVDQNLPHSATSLLRILEVMASNNNLQIKRSPQKTYSAFNALPTLRARDNKDHGRSPARTIKRPPQMADQILFPGRRLDRLQRSTYSGYSGRSLDVEIIVSGGRLNSADNNSIVGSVKPGPGLSPAFSRSLNDVTNQPWDNIRQLPSAHSHLSLTSNQGRQTLPSGSSRTRGIVGMNPGGSHSMVNLNADTSPNSFPAASGRWQLSDPHRKHNLIDKKRIGSSSPDSSYSSESSSEPREMTPIHIPVARPHRTQPTLARRPKPFVKKHERRHSDTINESSTPQLEKILWALVPDEFANISDTGISDHPQGTASPHYLTFTDLETPEPGSSDDEGDTGRHYSTRNPPTAPRCPALTVETLSQYSTSQPSDDRIHEWLAECDAQATSIKLPTHLPDINYSFTFKYSKPNS